MERSIPSTGRILGRLVMAVTVFGILGHLSWQLGDRLAHRLGLRDAEQVGAVDSGALARSLSVQRVAEARGQLADDPTKGEAALVALYGDSMDPAIRERVATLLVDHAGTEWPRDSRGRFLRAIAPAALRAGRDHGIPPSITMAQAALESGWGRSRLARLHHNLFGVKATGRQRAVSFPTREQTAHGIRIVRQGFRVFESDAASLAHHAHLLSGDPRYAAAQTATDWPSYLGAIAPVYATDKAYARRIGTIIRRHHLDRWDAVVQSRRKGGSQS
jgi:hypothetical protein